ncbi:MAG: hypothetical protein AAF654_09185 [Myxococcota bacterium]
MTAFVLLAVFAAPDAWCGRDGSLHLELKGAGISLSSGAPELYLATVDRPEDAENALLRGGQTTGGIEFRQSDGELRRLVIDGSGWRLLDGYDELLKNFRVPNGFRRGVAPLLLGVAGPYAWFASSSHIVRIDLGADRGHLRSGRIGRKALGWIFVAAGETARVIAEDKLLSCEPNLRCQEELQLGSPAKQIAHTSSGLLVATDSSLLRVDGLEVTTVFSKSPTALCAFSGGTAWVAIPGKAPLDLYTVNEETESHPLPDLLLGALPKASPEAALAWADVLVDFEWPNRRGLAETFSDAESSTLRRVAALLWRGEPGNAALARLWLLGHDRDRYVRETAVHSSREWCRRDEKMPCRAVLAAFVNDREREVSWTARDLLLDEDPWTALEGAPVDYRLEAVSKLSSRWAKRGEAEVREVLERLSADADPSVRAAAQMAIVVR